MFGGLAHICLSSSQVQHSVPGKEKGERVWRLLVEVAALMLVGMIQPRLVIPSSAAASPSPPFLYPECVAGACRSQ